MIWALADVIPPVPSLLSSWLPIAVQAGIAVWFAATVAARLKAVTDREEETQRSLQGALAEVGKLAAQIQANASDHAAFLERFGRSEYEIQRLRDFRHSVAGKLMVWDSHGQEIADLLGRHDRLVERVERVERIAERLDQ